MLTLIPTSLRHLNKKDHISIYWTPTNSLGLICEHMPCSSRKMNLKASKQLIKKQIISPLKSPGRTSTRALSSNQTPIFLSHMAESKVILRDQEIIIMVVAVVDYRELQPVHARVLSKRAAFLSLRQAEAEALCV